MVVTLTRGEIGGQPPYRDDFVHEDAIIPDKMHDLNVVYITSLRHNDRGTFAGFVVKSTVELAAQRLAEQTHRLSTEDEISQYTTALLAEADDIRRTSLAANAAKLAQNVQLAPLPDDLNHVKGAPIGPTVPSAGVRKEKVKA